MDLIGVLSFLFLASSCSSSVIPLALVPDVVLKERAACNLEKKPEISSFLQKNFGDCNYTVPTKVGQFPRNRETSLCFGLYDSVFELCEKSIFENFLKSEPTMDQASLCPTAKDLFLNIEYKFNDAKINEWLAAFKSIMTDPEKCSSSCIYNNEIDAVCSTAISAVKFLNDAKSDKKSPEETNPVETAVAADTVVKDTATAVKDIATADKDTATAVNAQSSVPSKDGTMVENEPEPPVETKAVPSKPLEAEVETKNEEKEVPESSNKEKESHNDPPNLEDNIDDLNSLDKIKETEKTDLEEEKQPLQPDEGSQQVDAPGEDDDGLLSNLPQSNPKLDEPVVTNTISDHFVEAEDSNFFSYFAMMTVACIFAYVFFHNKNKILALALEGRKQRSARGKGRHSSTNYSKLHSNLEEAIASNTTSPSSTHVLY